MATVASVCPSDGVAGERTSSESGSTPAAILRTSRCLLRSRFVGEAYLLKSDEPHDPTRDGSFGAAPGDEPPPVGDRVGERMLLGLDGSMLVLVWTCVRLASSSPLAPLVDARRDDGGDMSTAAAVGVGGSTSWCGLTCDDAAVGLVESNSSVSPRRIEAVRGLRAYLDATLAVPPMRDNERRRPTAS